MKPIISTFFISTILFSGFLSAQDHKWLAKQPTFGHTKPLVNTMERWDSDRGKIWIGVSFFYPVKNFGPLKYCGATPGIAGTPQTSRNELDAGNNNQIVEYVTKSGEVFWVPSSGDHGISATIVPTSESAKEIRLYDHDGKILGDFKADPKAVPPRWEPFMSPEGELTFERISGTEKDTWEEDHSIRPFARLSGDRGQTWVPFKGIVTAKPVVPIPADLKEKEQIIVDVFVSKDMAIEVTRYLISPRPGMRGVRLP